MDEVKTEQNQPVNAPEQPIQEVVQPKSSKFPLAIVACITIIFMAIFAWLGYQQFTKNNQNQEMAKEISAKLYKEKITIGYTPWPGYIGLFIARDKGYFAEEGLNVEIKEYPSLAEATKDYIAGNIQGKANLNLEAVNEALGGLEHQAVLVIDYSNGSDGIIASSEITDLSQIKGKKVAYEFGTLEEFFLTYALAEYSLSPKDILGVNLTPENAAKALVKKEVDVAVTYEPYMSPSLEQARGNKIYSSADAPGVITDILTFRKQFIDENPETIQAIVRAYFKALNFLEKNPQESYQILAQQYKATPEDVQTQLTGVKILNLKDNNAALTFAAGLQSLYTNIRSTYKFVKDTKGIESNTLNPDSLINPQFIKNLLQ